ncbi:MAG: hypothetical protein D3904_09945, partial [Candidatus Electrothrix sp. EH2]|nr:hypothetical protein [Candidatus Electrothrix sp. EH2]
MAFHAFVVGANYVDLEFARTDAEGIAAALKELDYKLPDPPIPPPEEDSGSILISLKKFADTCRPGDTLLFYFAGHGIQKSSLFLALDGYDSQHTLTTCLSISDISNAFKEVESVTKIIIL